MDDGLLDRLAHPSGQENAATPEMTQYVASLDAATEEEKQYVAAWFLLLRLSPLTKVKSPPTIKQSSDASQGTSGNLRVGADFGLVDMHLPVDEPSPVDMPPFEFDERIDFGLPNLKTDTPFNVQAAGKSFECAYNARFVLGQLSCADAGLGSHHGEGNVVAGSNVSMRSLFSGLLGPGINLGDSASVTITYYTSDQATTTHCKPISLDDITLDELDNFNVLRNSCISLTMTGGAEPVDLVQSREAPSDVVPAGGEEGSTALLDEPDGQLDRSGRNDTMDVDVDPSHLLAADQTADAAALATHSACLSVEPTVSPVVPGNITALDVAMAAANVSHRVPSQGDLWLPSAHEAQVDDAASHAHSQPDGDSDGQRCANPTANPPTRPMVHAIEDRESAATEKAPPSNIEVAAHNPADAPAPPSERSATTAALAAAKPAAAKHTLAAFAIEVNAEEIKEQKTANRTANPTANPTANANRRRSNCDEATHTPQGDHDHKQYQHAPRAAHRAGMADQIAMTEGMVDVGVLIGVGVALVVTTQSTAGNAAVSVVAAAGKAVVVVAATSGKAAILGAVSAVGGGPVIAAVGTIALTACALRNWWNK